MARTRRWPSFDGDVVHACGDAVQSSSHRGCCAGVNCGYCTSKNARCTSRKPQRAYIEMEDSSLIGVKDRLFHFGWQTQGVSGATATLLHDRATALVNSPELRNLHAAPTGQLWSWNAEGWYVVLKDRRLFAFTSEYQTTPPREITDLFNEIQGLPESERRSWAVRDVCLGFCYGPVAALGFQYSNQPCFVLARGATQCR